MTKRTISFETASYNEGRYGKPWIATVDFSTDKKGSFDFGDFIGSTGCAGVLEVSAAPGDIIAQGQEDHLSRFLSEPDYYLVTVAGFEPLCTVAEVYKAWQAAQDKPAPGPLAGVSDEDLAVGKQKCINY